VLLLVLFLLGYIPNSAIDQTSLKNKETYVDVFQPALFTSSMEAPSNCQVLNLFVHTDWTFVLCLFLNLLEDMDTVDVGDVLRSLRLGCGVFIDQGREVHVIRESIRRVSSSIRFFFVRKDIFPPNESRMTTRLSEP
jgi:hypothetical protein